MNKAIPRMLLLVGLAGCWPLWMAVVVVVTGLLVAENPNNYWTGAPWLIVAAIPACAITTLVAFAARFIFHRTEGGTFRRGMTAGVAYCLILGLLIVASR